MARQDVFLTKLGLQIFPCWEGSLDIPAPLLAPFQPARNEGKFLLSSKIPLRTLAPWHPPVTLDIGFFNVLRGKDGGVILLLNYLFWLRGSRNRHLEFTGMPGYLAVVVAASYFLWWKDLGRCFLWGPNSCRSVPKSEKDLERRNDNNREKKTVVVWKSR